MEQPTADVTAVPKTSSKSPKPPGFSIHAQLRRANSEPVLFEHGVSQGAAGPQTQSLRGIGSATPAPPGGVLTVTLGARPILSRRVSSAKATPQMRQTFLEESIRRDTRGCIHVEDFAEHLMRPLEKTKWVDDQASEGCQRCKKVFGVFRRRHHCRYCGWLVCAGCSPHRVVFRDEAPPQRVCERCLHRIIGRIDALYDRRYMRAVVGQHSSSSSTSGNSPGSDHSSGLRASGKQKKTFWTPPTSPSPAPDDFPGGEGGGGGGSIYFEGDKPLSEDEEISHGVSDADDTVVADFVANRLTEATCEDACANEDDEEENPEDQNSEEDPADLEPLSSSSLPHLHQSSDALRLRTLTVAFTRSKPRPLSEGHAQLENRLASCEGLAVTEARRPASLTSELQAPPFQKDPQNTVNHVPIASSSVGMGADEGDGGNN